jgi:hypothetical protein
MAEDELLKKYNALYLEMIMRYKEDIEQGETLYVAELPRLVTPQDEAVVTAVNKIKSAFPNYNYDQNFYDAALKAHKYVREAVATVSPPIQFWLKPSQVVNLGVGDIFDKAVLLCSMVIGLGNFSTKIISAIRENTKKHIVYCEFKEKLLTMDLEDGVGEVQNKDALLAQMRIERGVEMTAYEFNDRMYNNLI